jgi:hypothetical protein
MPAAELAQIVATTRIAQVGSPGERICRGRRPSREPWPGRSRGEAEANRRRAGEDDMTAPDAAGPRPARWRLAGIGLLALGVAAALYVAGRLHQPDYHL